MCLCVARACRHHLSRVHPYRVGVQSEPGCSSPFYLPTSLLLVSEYCVCLSGPRDKTSDAMRDLVSVPSYGRVHVGARCGVDARIAPPFMEATDASRLVCVVVVSYQEYSLTHSVIIVSLPWVVCFLSFFLTGLTPVKVIIAANRCHGCSGWLLRTPLPPHNTS